MAENEEKIVMHDNLFLIHVVLHVEVMNRVHSSESEIKTVSHYDISFFTIYMHAQHCVVCHYHATWRSTTLNVVLEFNYNCFQHNLD